MIPKIINLDEKKLVGKCLEMSFSANKTANLWKSFMPLRHQVKNAIGTDLYSVQVYGPGFFQNFNPHAPFKKWAAVEVSSLDEIPPQMESLTVSGLYAVFDYKGNSNAAESVFRYILSEWLPRSGYLLDNRAHFEILGPGYKNNDPDSEEQIYIPIRFK